jgi:hypothetical protein
MAKILTIQHNCTTFWDGLPTTHCFGMTNRGKSPPISTLFWILAHWIRYDRNFDAADTPGPLRSI